MKFKYDNNDQSLVLLIKNIKNQYQKKYQKSMSKIFLKTGKSRFLAHSQSVLSVSTFYLEFMFLHVFLQKWY